MEADTTGLRQCIARYRQRIPELSAIEAALQSASPDDAIALYEQCYPLIEKALWSDDSQFDDLLDSYQALFREQEGLIQRRGDDRHHFILSIPVADRPAHLQSCLESIHRLCSTFGYGGTRCGVYQRIKVIVAEDSREPESIERHIELVESYRDKGLQVFHFSQSEQYDLLHALPESQRSRLGSVLTTLPRERFYLKGQAANRNLSYLKCLQLTEDRDNTLYYMVDSDQTFCVNRQTAGGEQAVYALNYFHTADKVFRESDTLMLTGKLVGDPPVSPSVMTANFLDDMTAFFSSLAQAGPDGACRFHAVPEQALGDAAYHDMAKLFGFEKHERTYPYRCRLKGVHDNVDCLQDVSRRLSAFFFGEHLTRKTHFHYRDGYTALSPARTVYPGNYIVNYQGLKYIVPFGHLRLRMSGPTAGRLIAAEIGRQFASINMPHLHRRTAGAGLSGDFRPGVELEQEGDGSRIDLSDEFERQFFGDLMLFTTEALVWRADVSQPFPESVVAEVLQQKEAELLEMYRQKQHAIQDKTRCFSNLVFEQGHWWLGHTGLTDAMARIKAFVENIQHNFGERSPAWRQIQSAAHREQRKRQIIDALTDYRAVRDAWDRLFD
ncbi:MAG: hypothetical protein P8103_17050 [Candidatus Thiodiazotropha sp.]